jgi:type I restriction enzyme S subunit
VSGFPQLSISDFCETGSGGTPSRANKDYYGGNIPWVKSGELREGVITDTEEKITERAIKESSAKIVPRGAILLAMYGATVGRMAFLGVDAATNQAVCNIRPDPTRANLRYVFHCLQSQINHFLSRAAGGAQPNISQGIIKETKIPLPPLDEQQRIATILDKTDALHRKRKCALELLESLTRSIFLEMFGDPVSNPKKLTKIALGDLIKVKSGDGLVAKDMAPDGSFPVYGGNGINGYHDQFMFENPKLVIGRVGVYCGAVHQTQPKSWVTDNALYVSELKQPISELYLKIALIEANLNQYAGRAAQPLISGSRIYPIEILLPSKDEQTRFAKAIVQLSHLEAFYRAASASISKTFSSLQYRAFSGQL